MPSRAAGITLSPEAYAESKAIFEEIEPQLRDGLEEMEGWAGKLHGQIMRIAGIIHCCQYTDDAAKFPVTLETMQAARKIGRYLLAHAKAAFALMGLTESEEERTARYILRRMDSMVESEISKRDLFQLCNGKLSNMQQLDNGLAVLVEHGYISIEKLKTGGRPTERIFLNPVYLSTKGSKVQTIA